jgi:hypothetical protein
MRALCAGLVAIGLLGPIVAWADTQLPAEPKVVCDPATATVNKARLLQVLLDSNKVTMTPEEATAALLSTGEFIKIRRQYPLFATVQAQIDNIVEDQYHASFTSSNPAASGRDYMRPGSAISIACPTIAKPAPKTAARGDTKNPLAPLRVRGSPDDLIFNENDVRFGPASKATVSFSDNGGNKTRTDATTAAIGAAIDLGQFSTVIPYVAGNRNLSFTAGKPKKVSANTADAGVAAQFEIPSLDFGDKKGELILSARPDYLANFDSGARLITGNFVAVPYLAGVLNDYHNIGLLWCQFNQIPVDKCIGFLTYWSIAPLFDLRSDIGDYTTRGNFMPRRNGDYFRAGSKFGLDIYSKWLDFVVTHTYLHGFAGYYHSINYFQTSATYNLDQDKHFGITLSYKNGRLEATSLRDQSWTLGLTAKF